MRQADDSYAFIRDVDAWLRKMTAKKRPDGSYRRDASGAIRYQTAEEAAVHRQKKAVKLDIARIRAHDRIAAVGAGQ